MVNQQKFDVIIVGAGPAGCSAAIHALKFGLTVLILEARPFPRSRPGESLHPGIEPLFHQLGVMSVILNSDYPRPTGYFTLDQKTLSFNPYYQKKELESEWRGWIIPREEMDDYLLNFARSIGAIFVQSTVRLESISTGQVIVHTSDHTFYSDYILDGTGHNFWLSRQLGNPINRMSNQLRTYYGKCSGSFPIANEEPFFIRENNSWTWVTRLKPDIYQWTFMSYDNLSQERNFRPAMLKTLVPLDKTYSRDVTWRLTSSPSGKNYFCLGDAAFVTDPSSSKGVLRAVMSGMMASHLILNIQKKVIDVESASAFYNAWICNWFKKEYKQLKTTSYNQTFRQT